VDDQEMEGRWERWHRARDETAFEAVANHLQPGLVRYAVRWAGGDEGVACEAVEVALVELWRHGTPPSDARHLTHWLRQRIRARLTDARRARQRHPTLPLGTEYAESARDPQPGPAEEAEENEEREGCVRRVRSGLARLPRELGVVIHLLFYQDLTLTEAARRLELSVSAVSLRRSRALQQLGALLDDWSPGRVS
jgi:RNA polymerase sigma-70 factor (ECF subfamily)